MKALNSLLVYSHQFSGQKYSSSLFRVLFVTLLPLLITSVYGQNWTGLGYGVSWGDASNWSTNTVPTSSQTETITDADVEKQKKVLCYRKSRI